MQWSTVKEWIRTHPLESAFGGILVFFGILAVVFSGGEDIPVAGSSTVTIDPGSAPPTSQPDSLREGLVLVAVVDCRTLLEVEEIDVALGFDQLDDPPGMFVFAQGEVCVHTPDPDEGNFVRSEPGHPNDFEPGATIVGVVGELLEGVGDTAVWFSGQDPESGADVGVLSVSAETTLGWLYFRMVVGREGADESTLLDAARGLALAALPRFPGVVTEPELVVFEPEPTDPAFASYTANLQAKVESGEWTLGEGLLATLQALTGDAVPGEVLRNPDLIQQPAVSLVLQAREFAASNPEDPVTEEIDRLLGEMFPSLESLRDQGAIEEPSGRLPRVRLIQVMAKNEHSDPEQQEIQEAYCQEVWGTPAPCLVEFPLEELEAKYPGKYQLLVPFVTTEWDASTPADAAQAMVQAAELYESIGTMPEVQVVFTPAVGSAIHPMFPQETQCQVALGTNAGSGPEFQQRVAVTMAYCLIYQTLGDVWAEDGLAWYLGARVFDEVDLEHEWADDLANEELSTSIVDRWYTNWSLMEFVHPFLGGEKAVMEFAATLPESAEDFMHQYYLGLSDSNIPDLGGGTIPYSPMAWELTIGAPVEVPMVGDPYGVRRIHVTVAGGMKACAEYFSSGAVESSWRTGAPGSPGDWRDLPVEFQGESLFVATSTGSASLDMVVTRVVPVEDECEDTPSESPDDPEESDDIDPCCLSDHYREDPPATQDE